MSKKILILGIFVMVGLAVFLTGYLFSRKSGLIDQQALINNSLVERFNKTEEKYATPTGIFQLYPGEASFPSISATGELMFYLPKSGEIRSLSIKNTTVGSVLVVKIPPNASYISWATNKTLVAGYPTGSIFYNLTANSSKKYDVRIKNPVLNKTGDKIAYNDFDTGTGEGNIRIADPKLESYKNILPTRFSGWQISWLGNAKLSLVRPPALEDTLSSLFILDIESAALQNVLDSKKNLEINWSGNGQKLLYSYFDQINRKDGLYFMDLADRLEVPLNASLSASQCAWSIDGKTVYCAGKDSFVRVDTTLPNASPEEISVTGSSDVSANAINLLLTSAEDYLIFKNSQDAKLYGLPLSP